MNFFKRKNGLEISGTSSEDVSLNSSNSSLPENLSKDGKKLIKWNSPFENPVNPIKKPVFDLTEEQEEKYAALLKHFQDYITREIPINTEKNAPTASITFEEKAWLTKEGFLRYLRATKWNLPTTIKRIEETIIWRRSFGLVKDITSTSDKISCSLVEEENKSGKNLILGYDNDNRPCLYLKPGYQNTSPSIRQVQHLVFMLERVIQFMPPGQDSLALLIDFKAAPPELKLSSGFPNLTITKQVLHILQNHYPERLGRGLFTNIPWIGHAFFKVAGPFIDPYTRSKTIYDQPFENFVPQEQLDKEFNGLLDFKYDHDIYWNEMNNMAQSKYELYLKNFEKLGATIGLSEYDLRLKQEN